MGLYRRQYLAGSLNLSGDAGVDALCRLCLKCGLRIQISAVLLRSGIASKAQAPGEKEGDKDDNEGERCRRERLVPSIHRVGWRPDRNRWVVRDGAVRGGAGTNSEGKIRHCYIDIAG